MEMNGLASEEGDDSKQEEEEEEEEEDEEEDDFDENKNATIMFRFMQLMCEGHNGRCQALMQKQPANVSYDLIGRSSLANVSYDLTVELVQDIVYCSAVDL